MAGEHRPGERMLMLLLLMACATDGPSSAKPRTADSGSGAGGSPGADSADPPRSTWFRDADGDGYGDAEASVEASAPPSGHVADSSDCDDTRAAVNPGAAELCGNGLDDDCDGGPGECAPGGSIAVEHALRIQGTEAEGELGAALALRTGRDPALLIGVPGAGATGEGGVLTLPLPLEGGPVSLDTHPGVVGTGGEGALGTAVLGLENAFVAGAPEAEADAGAVLFFGESEPSRLTGRRRGDRLGAHLASDATTLFIGVPDDVGSGLRGAVEAVPLGSAGALAARSSLRIEGERPSRGFGTGLAAADLSGDGITDLIVGAPADDHGRLMVFLGPVHATVATDADQTLLGTGADAGLGTSLAAIGDVDGDGSPDLSASAPGGGSVLRLDGDAVLAASPGATALLVAEGRISEITVGTGHVAAVGDLDQDGLDDVLAAGPGVFWGPLEGVHAADTAPLQLTPSERAGGRSPPGWIGLGLPAGLPGGPALVVGGPSLEVDGVAAGEVQLVGASGT